MYDGLDLIFYITITKQNNKKCMIIRSFVYSEETMRKIATKLSQDGFCEVRGKIILKNPTLSMIRLIQFLKEK